MIQNSYVIKNYIGPLCLITTTPFIVYWLWFMNTQSSESLLNINELSIAFDHWKDHFFGTDIARTIIGIYALFELFLLWFIPGDDYYGPLTIHNNKPLYKANGFTCYLITISSFLLGSCVFDFFSPTIIYDHFGDILASLNIIGLIFCVFLYLKGIIFPSSTDSGTSGNVIFDYYWGTELHPTILGINIKQFTNCRFGMMAWPVIILSFAFKQAELYGLSNSMMVSLLLQFVYISKFFLWETGYFNSIDIMYDRAGYYICWGCLVWVPGFYTLTSLYLVNHPIDLDPGYALLLFSAGTSAILMNYFADVQRQLVRKTNGKCLIGGKKPLLIEAEYTSESGSVNKSLLLCSGYWGIARHFHYIPELIGAFCWALPALFDSYIPYFYFIFLSFLLYDRSSRDDMKCQKKYGKYWDEYCKRVPYKIIPYVY